MAAGPDLRARLGENGRAFVRERFTIGRLVDDQHALYLRLAAARGVPHPVC